MGWMPCSLSPAEHQVRLASAVGSVACPLQLRRRIRREQHVAGHESEAAGGENRPHVHVRVALPRVRSAPRRWPSRGEPVRALCRYRRDQGPLQAQRREHTVRHPLHHEAAEGGIPENCFSNKSLCFDSSGNYAIAEIVRFVILKLHESKVQVPPQNRAKHCCNLMHAVFHRLLVQHVVVHCALFRSDVQHDHARVDWQLLTHVCVNAMVPQLDICAC